MALLCCAAARVQLLARRTAEQRHKQRLRPLGISPAVSHVALHREQWCASVCERGPAGFRRRIECILYIVADCNNDEVASAVAPVFVV